MNIAINQPDTNLQCDDIQQNNPYENQNNKEHTLDSNTQKE